jgi:oxygen-independent coproporphyrinogen-3 oxidase
MKGLYVHIPFCDKLCKYCDFAKVRSHVLPHRSYLSALAKEYTLYQASEGLTSRSFNTVYFGGGTPSALAPDDLVYLLETFSDVLHVADEITFEANPESLTAEKIAILQTYGVNRVSLGVQTFNEKRLRFLNRGHTNAEVETALALLRQWGITNINLDLMYALPDETVADLSADITQLLALRPSHISTYALIFEPHTPFYLQLQQKKLQEVDEAIQEKMYRQLQAAFATAGYVQYEFSNWAQPGFGSMHNEKYWDLTEYVGLGLGAHGFYANTRYANTRSIVNYIEMIEKDAQLPVIERTALSEKQRMEEMMFLGLRLSEGVSKQSFLARFGRAIDDVFGEQIAGHMSAGHLIETPTHYQLAPDAVFISNEVLSDFLFDEEKE